MTARSRRSRPTPTTPPPTAAPAAPPRAEPLRRAHTVPPRPVKVARPSCGSRPWSVDSASSPSSGVILLRGGVSAPVDAASLITPASLTPTALADGRTLGKAIAVTLEVWTDFQCPIRGQYAADSRAGAHRQVRDRARSRSSTTTQLSRGRRAPRRYDESVEAGAGARCAADQNLVLAVPGWVFANRSGENEGAFADARLTAIATAAGLDVTAWDACRATGQAQTAVRSETQAALTAGVNATPTMRLNGRSSSGSRAQRTSGRSSRRRPRRRPAGDTGRGGHRSTAGRGQVRGADDAPGRRWRRHRLGIS